jgi:hypothetical protein
MAVELECLHLRRIPVGPVGKAGAVGWTRLSLATALVQAPPGICHYRTYGRGEVMKTYAG